ncbi:MAG: O-antigen ligase family protein [Sulfuritalea sp.]|nr:O-antigen ligase family protein [Sulfuritalea sp.]
MPAAAMTWFWQAWLAAVVFVFPIPHTIALRNLLLLVGLLAVLATLRVARRSLRRPALQPAAWALVAATAWLALHSIAVAPAPTLALDNLRGDWILPLLTAALAAYAAARVGPAQAIRAVVAALLAHLLWMFGWQLWLLLATGAVADGSKGIVPFGERDYHSTLAGFLLALLLGERMTAQSGGNGFFAARPAWIGLGLVLLADVVLRVRNGTLVSVLLLSLAALWMAPHRSRFVLLLLVVASLGGASLALDSRWSGLKESLAVGWNSPSLYWQNGDPAIRPPTPSGAPLEESAYARAAWAHQAVQAIAAQPLGLGYGRDGFGRAIEAKYGYKGMVSSHSGWLDFALAAGLPGLALLLLSAALAMRGGWRQFRQHDDAAGLMFCLLVGGYLLRCLLDGHLSGWRLGLFAFLCGVLIAAMKPSPQQTSTALPPPLLQEKG